MIRRILAALAVMTATIYWANCGFSVRIAGPATNVFFGGCFQGPVTDPAGSGDVVVVLEANTGDSVTLGGCLRLSRATGSPENGTLSGMVQDDRQQARVTVTPTSGPSYTLLVQRSPTGDVNATTVGLSSDGGAPFKDAANLARCAPQRTCSDLSTRMPFLPGGGMP
jgi:hypothetical protein